MNADVQRPALPSSARTIARSVTERALDPVDVVERALAAIEAAGDLNAVLTVSAESALARARAGVSGRLAGVPVLVKDIIDTAGIRTTIASKIYADRMPERSAQVVAAVEAEGAIVVGKTHCDEFAWGVSGQNVHWGDALNPRRPGRITGGSSSGNGAALAAGLCPLTIGTDTGGSVRMPAACCDVVGMKPAVGAIPTAGVFPLCPSFDTVGPMASTVDDAALAYAILRGTPEPPAGAFGLTVGVLTRPPALGPPQPGESPAPRDERGLEIAERLEALGARAVEIELPVPEADTWAVFYAEAAVSHQATFPARRDDYGPGIRAKLDDAQRIDPAAARAGAAALRAWRARAETEPGVDLIVSPTLGFAEIPAADSDELAIRVPMSAYTRVFSYLGWPAIAIGDVQLAGRDEVTVLGAALAWEQAYGPPAG